MHDQVRRSWCGAAPGLGSYWPVWVCSRLTDGSLARPEYLAWFGRGWPVKSIVGMGISCLYPACMRVLPIQSPLPWWWHVAWVMLLFGGRLLRPAIVLGAVVASGALGVRLAVAESGGGVLGVPPAVWAIGTPIAGFALALVLYRLCLGVLFALAAGLRRVSLYGDHRYGHRGGSPGRD